MAEVHTPRHRFLGRGVDKWCTFEDTFYAFKTDPPEEATDYEKNSFTNFITTTKIGVGGDDRIKKISFRLSFDPIEDKPRVEIITIAPTDETRIVGIVTDVEKNFLSRGVG